MASVLGWLKYLQPSSPGGRGAMCHMDPSPGCQPTPVPSNPISSPHSPGLGPGSWASCTPSQSQLPARTLQWRTHRGAGCMVAGTHSKDPGSPSGRGSTPQGPSQGPAKGPSPSTMGPAKRAVWRGGESRVRAGLPEELRGRLCHLLVSGPVRGQACGLSFSPASHPNQLQSHPTRSTHLIRYE